VAAEPFRSAPGCSCGAIDPRDAAEPKRRARPQAQCASSSASSRSCTTAAPWFPSSRRRQPNPEPVSAEAERLLYYALVGALEAGWSAPRRNALRVLRQASQPLGPMGAGVAGAAGAGSVRHATRQRDRRSGRSRAGPDTPRLGAPRDSSACRGAAALRSSWWRGSSCWRSDVMRPALARAARRWRRAGF
jgi:hypothetical protein